MADHHEVPAPGRPQPAPPYPGALPADGPAARREQLQSAGPAVADSGQPLPTRAQAPLPAAAKFREADLPPEKLAAFGLSLAALRETGQLQKLLKGEKTSLLTLQATGQPGQEPVKFEGKMVLHREANGTTTLKLELPARQLVIPNEIGGQPLTPEQRQRLATEGTAGLMRGLQDGTGRTYNAYVGVDKEMNKLVVLPENKVALQDTIAGVTLSKEQSHDLREGRAVHLAQLRREDGGRPFDGIVQIHAARAGVEIKPEPYELARRQAPAPTQKNNLETVSWQVPPGRVRGPQA